MRISLFLVVLALAAPMACLSQDWEFGGAGGYGWYVNPSISNPPGSAQAGFPSRGTFGAVFGESLYEHLGGEIRYLFQFGGPELRSDGTQVNRTGYTNVVVYDFLLHMTPKEARLRPFLAGGAGIKVFTSTGDVLGNQPLPDFARLVGHTQVEPTISAGAGLKYRLTRHAQVRVDFRTYFSPLPNQIFRQPRSAVLHGWMYDLVPMAGISYMF
jgi:hypothetical protein